MFRKPGIALAVLTGLIVIAGSALAANAHFIGTPTLTVSGNSIVVSASIAGLGNAEGATFSLTGSVDVFSRCYNRGGNKPQADNKQETIAVNQTQTFPVRNGRTDPVFTITPLSTLTCPGNQVVVIESISWNLTLSGEGVSHNFVS
jgi:hypothetical protein